MRSITAVLCAILVIISFSQVKATIIHVPGDSSTIQGGINGAIHGDTVLVAPGTYHERVNFNGCNLVLGSLFLTTGDTSYVSTTIIDGDSSGRVVTFVNGEDSTAAIIGFTIQNGYCTLAGGGGGVYCDNSNPTISRNTVRRNLAYNGGGISCRYSDPTISGNTISESSSWEGGGGIYCCGSDAKIIGNTIKDNSTLMEYAGGGGIYCFESNATISNNTISENSCNDFGGGILCRSNSGATITKNTIAGNWALYGGGVGLLVPHSRLEENLIIGNSSQYGGGGILVWGFSALIIRNVVRANSGEYGGGVYSWAYGYDYPVLLENIICENTAETGGGIYLLGGNPQSTEHIMYITNCTVVDNSAIQGEIIGFESEYGPSTAVVVNTILWNTFGSPDNLIYLESGDELEVTFSDIKGGWPGTGNIDCDPMFCYPDTGNYYLNDSSCCVGAGCDSLGNPDNTVDIGALGVHCGFICGDANADGEIDLGDAIYIINYLFKGDEPPQPLQAGDCTCDGIVDIGDVVYLLNYLFKGGPPPCEP